MALSSIYDASFGSIGFLELFDGGLSGPEAGVAEVFTEYHHDGSDDTTLVLFGKQIRTLELPIACMAAQRTSLEGAQGSTATLTYHRGAESGWTLIAVRDMRKVRKVDAYKGVLVLKKA